MKVALKIVALFLLLGISLVSFRAAGPPEFEGRIRYQQTFTDLQGQNITAKLSPYMGAEQRYFVRGGHYKAYNEKDQWMQLYDPETNKYYAFAQGKLSQTLDAATGPSAVVSFPKETREVIGYHCQSVQLVADGVTTIYYYSPKVRVNSLAYVHHQMGNWGQLLQVTNGALPLAFEMTNPKYGFRMAVVALEVVPMKLKEGDFTLPVAESSSAGPQK